MIYTQDISVPQELILWTTSTLKSICFPMAVDQFLKSSEKKFNTSMSGDNFVRFIYFFTESIK